MSYSTEFGTFPSSDSLAALLKPHREFLAEICNKKRWAFQYIHRRGASMRSEPTTPDFKLYMSLTELEECVEDAHAMEDESSPPWGEDGVLKVLCTALYAAPSLIFELQTLLKGGESRDTEGPFVGVTQAGVDALRDDLLQNLRRMYTSALKGL
jgi:hypothetical protein